MKKKIFILFGISFALLAGCSSDTTIKNENKQVTGEKQTETPDFSETKINFNDKFQSFKSFYDSIYLVESEKYKSNIDIIKIYTSGDAYKIHVIKKLMVNEDSNIYSIVVEDKKDIFEEKTGEKDVKKINEHGLYEYYDEFYWTQNGYSYNLSGMNKNLNKELIKMYDNRIKTNSEVESVFETFKHSAYPTYLPTDYSIEGIDLEKDFDPIGLVGGETLRYTILSDKYGYINFMISTKYKHNMPNIKLGNYEMKTHEINGVEVVVKEERKSFNLYFILDESMYMFSYYDSLPHEEALKIAESMIK